jgi:hypothetical protein
MAGSCSRVCSGGSGTGMRQPNFRNGSASAPPKQRRRGGDNDALGTHNHDHPERKWGGETHGAGPASSPAQLRSTTKAERRTWRGEHGLAERNLPKYSPRGVDLSIFRAKCATNPQAISRRAVSPGGGGRGRRASAARGLQQHRGKGSRGFMSRPTFGREEGPGLWYGQNSAEAAVLVERYARESRYLPASPE